MKHIHPNFQSGIPILVIGGAGYIGSHVCKELARSGFTPISYDNLSTGHSYAVKWGPLIRGDLSNRKQLDEVFETYKPQAVLHFAGSSLVIESVKDPGKYYLNNVASTVNLLECMKDHHVKFLVFSSTCATYGVPKTTPITESHPQNPISPYGRSKLMIEEITRDYEQAYGLKTIALRYFNAAGADFDCEIGENHTPETHLIPLAIETAMGHREKITIFGTDFDTKDGTAIRDYIHVQDLAIAHKNAVNWLLDKQTSQYLNLGTGKGFSVQQIIQAVERYSKKSLCVSREERRKGEPSVLVSSARKAQRLLEWSPQFSSLDTIISTAWRWHEHMHQNLEQFQGGNQKVEMLFKDASSLS